MSNERSGLLMIASSLLVIFVITGLLFRFQRESRREQTRAQGVGLVRLLSSIPYPQLVGAAGQQGPFEVMRRSQGNPDFAYGALVDARGLPLVQVAAPGVIVPPAAVPEEPSAWWGERSVALPQSGREAREFFAPLLSEGRFVALVRVGYLEPGLGVPLAQVPFVAVIALAVFLLTPLSYFLLRRELRPFASANAQIEQLLRGQQLGQVQIEATGELAEFARRFNSLVELAERRIDSLKSQQVSLLASSKVLSYKKTRLESVLETLPDAAIVMDEAGLVSFANAKLEALLGVDPEAARGRTPDQWCADTEVVEFLSNYAGEDSRLGRAESMRFSPRNAAGKVICVGAYPLADGSAAGESSGTLVLFRDMTSQALASQAQAEFVTHVAHELKAPLNVLAMHAEMLLGKDGESEAFRIEACNVLQDEVERLSLLVTTLLSIARLETGAVALDRQRVRLPEFLRDVLDTVSRGGQRAGLSFELELPAELPAVQIDKDLMRVALNNLLTNAIKYNREGGKVVLAAEATPDAILLRVRDSGIGIEEADASRIFEKFYRSEREEARVRGGHGLGLALAKEIVERHGGKIRLESVVGEGSEFCIVLERNAGLVRETV